MSRKAPLSHSLAALTFLAAVAALPGCKEEDTRLFDETGVWSLSHYTDDMDEFLEAPSNTHEDAFMLKFDSSKKLVAAAACSFQNGNAVPGQTSCRIGDPEDLESLADFEFEHALITLRVDDLSTQEIGRVVRRTEEVLAEVAPDLETTMGGFGHVFTELVDAVVHGQIVSLALSLFLVFLLVAFAFRSPVAGVYAVLPLSMAMPILFGIMGWLNIELNIVTAMLSSIMIGVGVDYTIHFLWRYRQERRQGLEPDEAVMRTLVTSGRGIVFNALSVVVGFAVLLISSFLPVKFFGILVVVSITACLVGALALLPALCLLLRPKFLEP